MKLLTLFFIIQSSFIWGQVSRVNKFKVLSAHEKIWVIFHPFVVKKSLIISDMVKLTTQDVLKENLLKGNGNSGQVDAFRHVFWMANLTKSIGWRKAKRLGIAHERGNYKDYKKHRNEDGIVPDKISSEMDLFNNNIGIEIGKTTDLENIKLKVIAFVLSGKCKIIKKDDDGNYLDCDGHVLSNEKLNGKWENEKCLVWSND